MISEKDFLDKPDRNYFECSNDIFDYKYFVKTVKRKVHKNVNTDDKGKAIHAYENVEEDRLLNNYEIVVYMYLCRCCNNGKSAFPSYSTIAKRCRISESSAKNAIKVLVDNGFLLKKNRGFTENNEGQVNKNYSNTYKINYSLEGLQREKW